MRITARALAVVAALTVACSSTTTTTKDPTTTASATGTATSTASVTYQVVQTWAIPNGGSGKVIVIPTDYLNDSQMKNLGDKLRNDTKSDRNAVVMIFDDEQAARVRDKVLAGSGTPADQSLYDRHFIGSYVRNGNTGFHALEVCYGGFVPSVDCHNIKY